MTMLESALEEIVLNAIDFTKSEKETLSEILTSKENELKELESKSMSRLEKVHAMRLMIQIERLKTNIGRLE